jgi:DNA mismatch repair protein MutS
MAVKEWNGEVLFLRRVIEQPASRSYGIEVARLAGLPAEIITRAREILGNLERGEFDDSGVARLSHRAQEGERIAQLALFAPAESRVIEELRTLEVDRMTPVEALNALARVVARLRGTPD